MNKVTIMAPISLGELIDKITILDIKLEHVTDGDQKNNILTEKSELNDILSKFELLNDPELISLTEQLINTNKKMWQLEDVVRDCIDDNSYNDLFIQVAKDIPITNDLRCDIKKRINKHFNSHIVEEKLYQRK